WMTGTAVTFGAGTSSTTKPAGSICGGSSGSLRSSLANCGAAVCCYRSTWTDRVMRAVKDTAKETAADDMIPWPAPLDAVQGKARRARLPARPGGAGRALAARAVHHCRAAADPRLHALAPAVGRSR